MARRPGYEKKIRPFSSIAHNAQNPARNTTPCQHASLTPRPYPLQLRGLPQPPPFNLVAMPCVGGPSAPRPSRAPPPSQSNHTPPAANSLIKGAGQCKDQVIQRRSPYPPRDVYPPHRHSPLTDHCPQAHPRPPMAAPLCAFFPSPPVGASLVGAQAPPHRPPPIRDANTSLAPFPRSSPAPPLQFSPPHAERKAHNRSIMTG